MNQDTPSYYMPYDSGDDTDDSRTDDSEDYDSDNLPDFEDPRIRREEDPRYAIIRTAGPNFNTSAQQLKYMEHAPGAAYDNSTNITSLNSLVYLNPPKTTQTSLFSIKSLNRDVVVYNSPFNFQLKTPRVYKNVTKLQLVQISFPNNTQAFSDSPLFEAELIQKLFNEGMSPSCISTCLTVTDCSLATTSIGAIEKGRTNNGAPFMVKFSIPGGLYSNEQIAATLNRNSNLTPPFNLISYEDFKKEFQIFRDISILFNEPGDHFYSNINKTYHSAHTKQTIMEGYYNQTHIDSIVDITDKVAFNAYYYPILKEIIITSKARMYLNTFPYTFDAAYDYVVAKFLGLESDIYYNLCLNNRGVLDGYRRKLTFENTAINKYNWFYDTNQRRFGVIHNTLHPSLTNDINNKFSYYLNNELTIKGLTAKSFQILKTSYATHNSVFQELQSYLSTQLSNYFFVSDYSYSGGQLHAGLDATTQLEADVGFTTMFNFSKIFGQQFHSNFNGHKLAFTNFLDYHSTMSSYYNTIINTSTIISSVYGNTNLNQQLYVSTKYSSVLPYSYINTKTYQTLQSIPVSFVGNMFYYSNGLAVNDPLIKAQTLTEMAPGSYILDPPYCQSQCCSIIERLVKSYYGCLPVDTVVNNYPNSLGYRLGLLGLDFTNFVSVKSTIFNVTSTQNFNVFLQLNTEYSANNMDIAMTENYSVSNETTGQIKLMAAKILMQGIGTGEVSETAIQNPILFETPLGKLDKLSFKMYIDDTALTPLWQYLPFDIGINEWDATFQIDEEIAYADRSAGFSGNVPTVPIPSNPAAFQYMALTSSSNTLNK